MKKNFHMKQTAARRPDTLQATTSPAEPAPVHVREGHPDSRVVVVCEHAVNRMSARFGDLGIDPALLDSHIAWDPGALGVAEALAKSFRAPLVHGGLSRLLYDCNRPPQAKDAIPDRSEIHDIPGNRALSETERTRRVEEIYNPFHASLADVLHTRPARPVLITVHSFTPVYRGVTRAVELGILHGEDPTLARAMLTTAPEDNRFDTRINEPYGPADGVAYTLDRHGSANGLLNVMLEIRNDLIATSAAEQAMARMLAPWLEAAMGAAEEEAGR